MSRQARIPINLGPGGHPPDPVNHARLKKQLQSIIDNTDFEETDNASNASLSLINIGDQVGLCYMYVDSPEVKGIVLICSRDQAHEGIEMFRESARQSGEHGDSTIMLKELDDMEEELRRQNRELAELN